MLYAMAKKNEKNEKGFYLQSLLTMAYILSTQLYQVTKKFHIIASIIMIMNTVFINKAATEYRLN